MTETLSVEMVESKINDRWELVLPEYRREFHESRKEWEAGRLADLHEHVGPGSVVWDVGAECGDFSCLYRSWVGDTGTVVCIEPSPPYWPCIRQTWEANNFGAPPDWFVGFASDTTSAALVRSTVDDATLADGWPACSVGEIIPDFGFRHLAQQTNETPQTRLDDFAGRYGPPDVVTVDIEGAEWHCLSGCTGLMETSRPEFYVSVHDIGTADWPGALAGWYGKSCVDIYELLAGFDYRGTELPFHGEGEHFHLFEPR